MSPFGPQEEHSKEGLKMMSKRNLESYRWESGFMLTLHSHCSFAFPMLLFARISVYIHQAQRQQQRMLDVWTWPRKGMNKGMMERIPSIPGSPSLSHFHPLFSLLANEVSAPRCFFFFFFSSLAWLWLALKVCSFLMLCPLAGALSLNIWIISQSTTSQKPSQS